LVFLCFTTLKGGILFQWWLNSQFKNVRTTWT
jgi:hypothetical protein